MPSTPRASGVNYLLHALPGGDLTRVLSGCDVVELAAAEVVYAPGAPLRQVFFPLSGFISLIMQVDDASFLEVALVGNEGMLGIPLLLGVDISSMQALVQGAGSALRMETARFRQELRRSPALLRAVGRYAYVRMAQLAQMSACTRFHLVEARLARWILMTQDRAYTATIHITQEMLSLVLGVRRVGITNAASSLQRRGLIHYSRGRITVVDRRGLKAAACACYRANRVSYDRLLDERAPRLPGSAGADARRVERMCGSAHTASG